MADSSDWPFGTMSAFPGPQVQRVDPRRDPDAEEVPVDLAAGQRSDDELHAGPGGVAVQPPAFCVLPPFGGDVRLTAYSGQSGSRAW